MTLSVSKEANRPMTLNKLFVLGAAVAALGVAAGAAPSSGAWAQTSEQKALIDAAKVQGVVGEQADGYLGIRTPPAPAPLAAAVSDTNDARRAVYGDSARAAGTTTDVAAARMFEAQLFARIPAGQWYRNASGQWVRR
ncbi:YdbL family protein [Brevundimonas aurifodinae]|uniref:YdbL family protein n=2 Tax=Brevundimonas TaxID=41275 RepID=A0ABV1NQS4_9CAUL